MPIPMDVAELFWVSRTSEPPPTIANGPHTIGLVCVVIPAEPMSKMLAGLVGSVMPETVGPVPIVKLLASA
jgi:hypothetical protein